MNQQMYKHPATQANLQTLAKYNYRIIGPDHGDQACGDDGPGRMTEPDEIIQAIVAQQYAPGQQSTKWAGLHVMITTGPTQEAIDPVRYISNHSSGLQGLSIANAALARGARVSVIAGPRVPESNPAITRGRLSLLLLKCTIPFIRSLGDVDVFIGVAAVADYRSGKPSTTKRLNAQSLKSPV